MRNKKKIAAIIAIMLITAAAGIFVFAACSGNPAVGFWIVDEVTAGDVVMNQKDAQSVGYNAVGTVKLQKSGNCEVVLLGEETTGKWNQASDGTITINHGDKQTLTGSINEDGIMTLVDPQGTEYVLSK